METRRIALNAVISEVALGHRLGGRDVRWRSHPCGTVRRPGELARALHLLLDSAADRAPGTPVTLTAEPDGRSVEIGVTDSGPALDSCTDDLFLARRLVVGAGGALRVDTDYDAGTRFVVRMPVLGGARS